MLKDSFFKMVAIRFFQVEPGAWFRFDKNWWKRTGMNDASTSFGCYQRMNTETLVGIMRRDLRKNSNVTIIPLPLKEKDPDPF